MKKETNPKHMTMRRTNILPTLAALALGITSSHAAITVVHTGFANTNGGGNASANLSKDPATPPDTGFVYTHSYDAGASFDMLVVTVSREGGTLVSLKFDGVDMIPATVGTPATGVSIFYLNTTATSGNLVADFTNSGTNGIGIGIAAIKSDNGDPIGVYDADFGTGTTISIDTADDSFTMWAIDTNLGVFGDLDIPPFQINRNTDIGSNGYAAAYEEIATGVVGDTYSYTNTANPRGIAAANFVVVPEPSAAFLGLAGTLLLLRRRRFA
jgi:hypothetical protein